MKGDTELKKFANQLSAVGTGTDGGIGMVRYAFKLAAILSSFPQCYQFLHPGVEIFPIYNIIFYIKLIALQSILGQFSKRIYQVGFD